MLPTEYNDDLVQDFEIETQPTRTYALRFDGYPCSGGKLDGLEAMKQAIFLILQTERFQYAIYSWNYGIELNALLGQTMTPICKPRWRKQSRTRSWRMTGCCRWSSFRLSRASAACL